MNITVNGKPVLVGSDVNIKELLGLLKVEMQEYVTVQVNDEILITEQHGEKYVQEGDVIEFLYFMGGGAI